MWCAPHSFSTCASAAKNAKAEEDAHSGEAVDKISVDKEGVVNLDKEYASLVLNIQNKKVSAGYNK